MTSRRWVVLSDGARPTEDIYFMRSVAPWLRTQGAQVQRVDTRRWPSALCSRWLHGAHVLVCRSLSLPWIAALERRRGQWASLRYLIDDDIPAAVGNAQLPATYRERMRNIAEHQQPRLLALVDEVVVCSGLLAERFQARHESVSVLTPPLIAPLPPLAHFADSPWCVGCHGTRVHLPDLEQIAPAITAIHEHHADLSFEIMLGRHTPSTLAALPGVATPPPLPWGKFRRYQRKRRIHIGLSPLWPTAFNAGKSFIKLLDIAAMGGVGIYSNRAPYAEIITHGEDGLLAGDSPGEWQACLERLLDDPAETRHMAERAAEKARELGDPQRAQAFWRARSL